MESSLISPLKYNMVESVRSAAQRPLWSIVGTADSTYKDDVEGMSVDITRKDLEWQKLLDCRNFQRSVYVMQVLDSFLQPASETLNHVNNDMEQNLTEKIYQDAISFRHGFIESGGFDAILRLLTEACIRSSRNNRKSRLGCACALRILKCCYFCGTDAMSFTGYQPNFSSKT